MSIDFSAPLSIPELAADLHWWRIYHAAFPLEEREPEPVILRSLEAGVGIALRARSNGNTVGIATLHLLREVPAAFCVYLAVASHSRGTGVGRRLFQHVVSIAGSGKPQNVPTPRGLVWEVEDPAAARSQADADYRNRRIRFFESVGGTALPHSYLQPPLNGKDPVPMRLMWLPFGEAEPPAPERLMHAIYFEKYGAINGIAPAELHRLLRPA